MLRDWGSRDADFIALNARVRARIVEIAGCATAAGGGASHVCVPIQGSGTFAVEAAVGTFVPRDGKLLVLVNGTYGRRIARMCAIMGRAHATAETPEDTPNDPAALETALAADAAITHVAESGGGSSGEAGLPARLAFGWPLGCGGFGASRRRTRGRRGRRGDRGARRTPPRP